MAEGGPADVVGLLRSRTAGSACVVVTHRNADPDALAASWVMMYVCRKLGYVDACIIYPEGLSKVSKRVASALGLEAPECGALQAPGGLVVVVVDASNTSQLAEHARLLRDGDVVLIDHHEAGDILGMSKAAYHRPGAASATQLALDIAREAGAAIDAAIATLAVAGILYDTRRFAFADADALRWVATLLEIGADYHNALKLLQGERADRVPEFSERWARLKAAQRARLARFCKDYIVAVTHIGSFESSAARSLLELGADVAVVATAREGEARVSVRVSRRAAEAGVTASRLAAYIAERYGGRGGGHEQAGMAHIRLDDTTIDELVEDLAKSVPGKAARMCVEARGGRESEEERARQD